MKSINFMGDNGFKKALESVGVTASSSISSEKISGCFKYVTADDMCIITGYCGDSHIEVLELPFELRGKKVIAVAGGYLKGRCYHRKKGILQMLFTGECDYT